MEQQQGYPLSKIVLWSLAGLLLILLSMVPSCLRKTKKDLLLGLERSRAVEALATLSKIKFAEESYLRDKSVYADFDQLTRYIKKEFPRYCSAQGYFYYDLELVSALEYKATATRCIAGGKEPQADEEYTITIGNKGGFASSLPGLLKEK